MSLALMLSVTSLVYPCHSSSWVFFPPMKPSLWQKTKGSACKHVLVKVNQHEWKSSYWKLHPSLLYSIHTAPLSSEMTGELLHATVTNVMSQHFLEWMTQNPQKSGDFWRMRKQWIPASLSHPCMENQLEPPWVTRSLYTWSHDHHRSVHVITWSP